jgi:putative transposase
MLASTTRLVHLVEAAKLSLAVDASATHIGACLQQKRAGSPGFFSKKLEPAQVKYLAFDRELLACFLGIRHFRYMLEGRHFTIYTDHKPLTTAINRASDPVSLLTWRSIPLTFAT